MNEHQRRLWQNMIDLIQSYLNGETEDFYKVIGGLEGALDASEIKDDDLIHQWYDLWMPLEIRRAVEGNNINKIKALEELNGMQKLLLSKQNQKKYLPEEQIRELIHQAGIQTFPRPIGIPENYLVTITDRSGGMRYIHSQDPGFCIRVMPGKPHSPFPHQQHPYIVHTKNGQYLDKFGNMVSKDSPHAHIPIDEFTYIGN